ncbi:MAG TPA: hypothetical protein ENI87_00600 [bacterium]|nr:hypothetical protein [bacterium]
MSFPNRTFSSIVALLLALAGCTSPEGPEPDDPATIAVRVGVYDGRAVCIAYVNGPKFEQWRALRRKEYEAAKAVGDEARAAEISAVMAAKQEQFHAQTFGGEGVDDILLIVADALPALMAAARVERLERINCERGGDVVTVDVTDRLVDLFAPSERAREWIADIRPQPFPR